MKHNVETEESAHALRSSMHKDLDVDRTYHPVFCTAAISDAVSTIEEEYHLGFECITILTINMEKHWARFVLADPVNPSRRDYLEISSLTASSEIIQQRQSETTVTEASNQLDTEFLDCELDEVYDFWRRNLRAADNSEGPYQLSAFTFVVIDEACLNSDRMQCIVCSDAPDFGEADDAIVVKQVRIDATKAWCIMVALEELTMTPSETAHWAGNWEDKDFSVLNVVARPPTTMTLVEDENRNDIVRRYATPAEARANKRKAIKAGEREGWVLLKGFPENVDGAIYDL